MKKILLLLSIVFFISTAYSQKSKCDKIYYKEKKSSKKSTVFSDDINEIIKTKYCPFFAKGNRSVSIAFIKNSEGLKLEFLSVLLETAGMSMKREVILGQNIKIAFIFDDGTNEIIQFGGAEQEAQFNSAGSSSNKNYIKLTKEFLNKLATKKIVNVELQNPFNMVNDSPVKDRETKSKYQDRVVLYANCFKNRIQ